MQWSVATIVGHPGASQELQATVAAEDLQLAGEITAGPVAIDLVVEGVVEGVLATGRLSFDLHRPCARCLVELVEHQDLDVAEVFFHPARRDPADDSEPDYVLVEDGTELDLTALLHDSVLIGQPVRTLCRPDCAGLCAVCGVDRNLETCDCDTAAPADPRWAALADVELD